MTEEATTSVHLATRDGEAMVFIDDVDLSSYAGSSGDTTYMLEFEDSAGVKATGYCIEAGGGLTLGSELATNGDFSTGEDWNEGTGWSIAGGVATHATGSTSCLFQDPANTLNSLCYISYIVNSISGGLGTFPRFGEYLHDYIGDSGEIARYGTVVVEERLRVCAHIATECEIDNVSFKKVTDIPATGLKLVSTLDGSTRNMATEETGFDPNDIDTVRIYKVK